MGADAKVGKVGVGERFGSGDPGAGVERQHLAEKVRRLRRVVNGQLLERSPLSWIFDTLLSSHEIWHLSNQVCSDDNQPGGRAQPECHGLRAPLHKRSCSVGPTIPPASLPPLESRLPGFELFD